MDIQTLIGKFGTFINTSLIPFILTIAFLVFIWKMVEFSIIGAANEESREKARSQALWSLFAFVIIISFWGIVNLFSSSIGLENQNVVIPDYMKINQTDSPTASPLPVSNPQPSNGLPTTQCAPNFVWINGYCQPETVSTPPPTNGLPTTCVPPLVRSSEGYCI